MALLFGRLVKGWMERGIGGDLPEDRPTEHDFNFSSVLF
jgi:hypothetical protein